MTALDIRRPGLGRLLRALPFVYFLWVFLVSLTPVESFDLWWHLKSGEWMVENRSLAGTEDPFSFTSHLPLEEDDVKGLRTQWLGQIVFYLSYLWGGLRGVALLKAVLIALPFLLVYIRLVGRGAGPFPALSILVLPSFLASFVFKSTFERPAAFSFLFALFVLLLLENLRGPDGGPKKTLSYVLMPFSMALWANLHGGYPVGVLMIAAYMAGEAVSSLIRGKRGPSAGPGRGFYAVCIVSMASSLINPNTYWFFLRLFSGFFTRLVNPPTIKAGYSFSNVFEYMSPWFIYKNFYFKWPLFVLAFMAVSFLVFAIWHVRMKRLDIPRFSVFAVSVFLGVFYLRGGMFALILMPVLIGGRALFGKAGMACAVLMLSMAVVCASQVVKGFEPLAPSLPETLVSGRFPEGATNFILENRIQGGMFNFLPWGGYLIWRTNPIYKVFSDGRLIDSKVLYDVHVITNAGPGYRMLLDKYGVDFVIIPLVSEETNDRVPLAEALAWDGSFRLLYLSGNEAVFVRADGKNAGLIDAFEIPMDALWSGMLDAADRMLSAWPGNPSLLLSKTIALRGLKRYEDAGIEAGKAKRAALSKGGNKGAEVYMILRSMGY